MVISQTPRHWLMEGLKRRLDPLAELIGTRRVVYVGMPAADDIGGQLAVEGADSFFGAHGLTVVERVMHEEMCGGRVGGLGRDAALVFHGDDLLGHASQCRAIQAVPPTVRVVVLPSAVARGEVPEQGLGRPPGGPPWGPNVVVCVRDRESEAAARRYAGDVRLFPDMTHALWGLLDHYPEGEGVLTPERQAGMVPASRIGLLRRQQDMLRRGRMLYRLLPATVVAERPLAFARRRVIEGARRAVARHQMVEEGGLRLSILAALLGRSWRTRDAAVAGYWAGWSDMVS